MAPANGEESMAVMEEIGQALAREFALPDVGTTTLIVARLLTATILGGLVGMERERTGHPAGLRTHILVSIGSALFVLAPLLAGIETEAVTRVMQGIVQGIGFLGAGAILKQVNGDRVEGLTSAAGIWMTAAIGMAAGMGQEVIAVAATGFALVVIALLPRLVSPRPRR